MAMRPSVLEGEGGSAITTLDKKVCEALSGYTQCTLANIMARLRVRVRARLRARGGGVVLVATRDSVHRSGLGLGLGLGFRLG